MNKFLPNNYKYKKRFLVRNLNQSEKTHTGLNDKNLSDKKSIYGLKILKSCDITAAQLEACRRIMTKKLKKKGKVIIYPHPGIPSTKKSLGVRMGKGVGAIEFWYYPAKKGKIIFEILDVDKYSARRALQAASHKIGVPCKFIFNYY